MSIVTEVSPGSHSPASAARWTLLVGNRVQAHSLSPVQAVALLQDLPAVTTAPIALVRSPRPQTQGGGNHEHA